VTWRNSPHRVAEHDWFFIVPLRFLHALERGDVNGRQFKVGCYLAGAIDYRTRELALSLRALAEGCDYGSSDDTLLRDIKAMRPTWIEFEIGQGQRRPYVFRLTGLARDEHAIRPDFRTATPSPAEVTSAPRKSDLPEDPEPERPSGPGEPPDCGGPPEQTRQDHTREDHVPNPAGEEGEHLLGKTTAASQHVERNEEGRKPDEAATERLVEGIETQQAEPRSLFQIPASVPFGYDLARTLRTLREANPVDEQAA
jgi:hypothetical protein